VDVLIEREAELAVLEEAIAAARAGEGRAVLVEGEAGIGKTRLLEAARARAIASGARALYATADEIEADVPLAAARGLLARASRGLGLDGPSRLGVLALAGGLGEAGAPASRGDQVVHALWWLIVELAEERPLALFLDDAQWADELTLGLLRLAARRARELPLALVVAARPAGSEQRHAGLTAERAFVRLEPAPLSAAGTARLLEAILGAQGSLAAAKRARAATGGNPLYLRELLQDARVRGGELSGDGEPPPQLVRLLADRLRRLSSAATGLAGAISVLGPDANTARARALVGLAANEAIIAEEELRVERLLDRRSCAFTHPVVAAAVREALGTPHAAGLHARAAALLAGEGVSDERVAEHLMRAAPSGDVAAVATLRRAAVAARRLGAYTIAARLLSRALAEPPPPDEVDAVDFERGRALLDAGDEAGVGVLTDVARRAADVSVRVDAVRVAASGLRFRGRGQEAVALLRGVLDTLSDSDRERQLELLVEITLIGGSSPASLPDAQRTISAEAATATGDTPAERLVMAAADLMRGKHPSDPARGARQMLARRLYRDYPGGFAAATLTFAATSMLINADALDEAAQAMDTVRGDAEAMAQPDLVVGALWQQAQIAYARGDLPRCELEARAATEAGGDLGRALATTWLVMVRVEQGRLDAAERLLESAGLLGPSAAGMLPGAGRGGRGHLRLAQGDPQRAIDDLAAMVDLNAAYGLQRVEPPWQPLLTEALVLADRREQAAEEAEAYATLAASWGTQRALGHAARLRALIAPREQAIAQLEQAATHFAASHARLEYARTLTELGARRRAAGERRAARAILRDAHDAAYTCRAGALCDRARAELRLAGGRPRPPAGAGANALTPAERRVAEIAAQGAGNREIARHLYLSPKTVEMHLRSAYRKLDLAGRRDLSAALRPATPTTG
jgi:DNA-binding CsgD family transcriptional regulator